ncbi:MAG: lmo0937 family membrane protein [bacterium]|nr:lmo0937 family membrane protein [bacterium]
MLWTIGVVLLILWVLGLVAGITLSGFIHLMPVIALAAIFLQLVSGRRINDY